MTTYMLPDGREIQLGSELVQAPELLFNPAAHPHNTGGSESIGLPRLMFDAIKAASNDLSAAITVHGAGDAADLGLSLDLGDLDLATDLPPGGMQPLLLNGLALGGGTTMFRWLSGVEGRPYHLPGYFLG